MPANLPMMPRGLGAMGGMQGGPMTGTAVPPLPSAGSAPSLPMAPEYAPGMPQMPRWLGAGGMDGSAMLGAISQASRPGMAGGGMDAGPGPWRPMAPGAPPTMAGMLRGRRPY